MAGESKQSGAEWSHRQEEAPAKNSRAVKVFDCPKCGASVTLRAPGQSLSVVCGGCKSILDPLHPAHKVLSQADAKRAWKPLIPLGKRCNFKGQTWECIGFMVRQDKESGYFWREYLLFNPYRGYRWLAEADGHWSFVTPTKIPPKIKADQAYYDGRVFKVYTRGQAIITYIEGEFYWQAAVGEKTAVADFIAPPYMLSMEKDGAEVNWSVGEYLPAGELQRLFGLVKLRQPEGVAPHQPSDHGQRWVSVRNAWLAGCIALLIAQVASMALAPSKMVYDQYRDIVKKPDGQWESIIVEGLIFERTVHDVVIEAESAVDNSWIELEAELQSKTEPRAWELSLPMEFYHGVSGGENWNEGSRSKSVLLNAIPGGEYNLLVQPHLPEGQGNQSMRLTVKRGVPLWGNFLLAMLAFAIWPLFVGWRTRAFEVQRWSSSDYSPYATEGEDE